LEIMETAGTGADTFALLKTPDNITVGWFRGAELAPAPLGMAAMEAAAKTLQLARSLIACEPSLDLRAALHRVGMTHPAMAEQTRRRELSAHAQEPMRQSQSREFAELAQQRAKAKGIPLATAIREVSVEQPALAAAYQRARPGRFTRR
jgi:pimeloyl-ACP methyl ester carboxylesterase